MVDTDSSHYFITQEKGHFPFIDMAYQVRLALPRSFSRCAKTNKRTLLHHQGFSTGSVDRDAYAPRYFVEQGIPIVLAQSFAKVRECFVYPSSQDHLLMAMSQFGTEHGIIRRASGCFLGGHRFA
jgi:hypothetical protein